MSTTMTPVEPTGTDFAEATDTANAATCSECGATWNTTTCTDYFHELLALDHQRIQPFGRFHGLNVACYLLQHPSAIAEGQQRHLGALWQMITVYLSGGIEAVNDLEHQRMVGGVPSYDSPIDSGSSGASESSGSSGSEIPVPPRTRKPSITIKDVATDGAGGMFPVGGYEDRMHLWVLSIATERGLASAA